MSDGNLDSSYEDGRVLMHMPASELLARLTSIEVIGILSGSGRLDPFAIVYVDDEERWRSKKQLRNSSPTWLSNCLLSFHPSSTIRIDIVRGSMQSWFRDKTYYVIGRLTSNALELLENDSRLLLTSVAGVEMEVGLRVKLSLVSDPTKDVASSIDGLSTRENDNTKVATLSAYVDVVALTTKVVDETAQALGPCNAPLAQALQSLERIVTTVDGIADVHPICKVAWMVLSSVYRAVQAQMLQDDAIRDLAESLRDMVAVTNECQDLRVITGLTSVIKDMGRATLVVVSLIDEYARLSFAERTLRSVMSADMSNRIQQCDKRNKDLMNKFSAMIAIDTNKGMKEMKESMDQKAMSDLLDKLPSVPMAKYDPERRCMDGTRKEIISAALEWASTPGESRVYWIGGQAGRGKTAIATSIACALSDAGSLGGTFFFRRDDEERRKPDKVFSSIAYQMSTVNEPFRAQICAILSKDRDAGKYGISDQFKKLIQEPLQATKDLQHPVIILLDALDECGTTDDERKSFLHVVYDRIGLLPDSVKFVITSRPDPDLMATFRDIIHNSDLDKHAADLVSRDIMKFFTAKLADVALSHDLGSDWPGGSSREALTRRAMGLFQWAKVACDVIKDDDSDGPDAQLKFILANSSSSVTAMQLTSSPWAALDILYLQVLRQAATASGSRLSQLRDILATIILAQIPLSTLSLGALLGVGTQTVQHRLRKLHSVVDVPNTSQGVPRIIHPSFADFLTDHCRCADDRLYISPMLHHTNLAKICLFQMQCDKGDMCEVADARTVTSNVVEELLRSRRQPENDLTDSLIYVCQFWAVHVSLSSSEDAELHRLVRGFLSHNYLHFIFGSSPKLILSLSRNLRRVLRSVLEVVEWALKAPVANHWHGSLADFVQPICIVAYAVISTLRAYIPIDIVGQARCLLDLANKWSHLRTIEGSADLIQGMSQLAVKFARELLDVHATPDLRSMLLSFEHAAAKMETGLDRHAEDL